MLIERLRKHGQLLVGLLLGPLVLGGQLFIGVTLLLWVNGDEAPSVGYAAMYVLGICAGTLIGASSKRATHAAAISGFALHVLYWQTVVGSASPAITAGQLLFCGLVSLPVALGAFLGPALRRRIEKKKPVRP